MEDLSSYHHKVEEELQGRLAVYVDDTFQLGEEGFIMHSDKIRQEFGTKRTEFPPLLFSSVMVDLYSLEYFL